MSDAPLHAGDTLEAIFADRRWVVWAWVTRQGMRTKVPYVPGVGRKAESDNPLTWRSYLEASATFAKGNVDGLGYVLTKRDDFCALDLDHCRDATSGALELWASELVTRADSYTEITPSGEGVRILGIATGVPDAHFHLPRRANGQRIEVFHRATRYITISQKPLDGTPRPLADISAIVAELQAENDRKKAGRSAVDGSQLSGTGLGDDTAELVRQVMTGEVLHPALIPLAARFIGSGTYPGAVVNFLRALMQQVPVERRDERWRDRYVDIRRIVQTAEAKFRPDTATLTSDDPAGQARQAAQLFLAERRAFLKTLSKDRGR